MATTIQQVQGALQIVRAVADAIRELKGVPSSHLYARLMGYMDLATYTKVIETLKRSGLVKESGHLLTWVEPEGKR